MTRHRFHGDPRRFEVLAEYIADRYGRSVEYIADVAGGRGMLARILSKKYNYTCEVVDPRGWVLKGVESRQEEFDPQLAAYCDLVVGLHPDEALQVFTVRKEPKGHGRGRQIEGNFAAGTTVVLSFSPAEAQAATAPGAAAPSTATGGET